MFSRSTKILSRATAMKRTMSTLYATKSAKSIIGIGIVASAVILMAPKDEFDDLDCQSHVCQEVTNPDCTCPDYGS